MVQRDELITMTNMIDSSTKKFLQSDDEPSCTFPIEHSAAENFYSVTAPSANNNAEYDVVDETTKKSESNLDVSYVSKMFNTKLSHPFSASILKTTKSITDS